jgi:hypothetical protein
LRHLRGHYATIEANIPMARVSFPAFDSAGSLDFPVRLTNAHSQVYKKQRKHREAHKKNSGKHIFRKHLLPFLCVLSVMSD